MLWIGAIAAADESSKGSDSSKGSESSGSGSKKAANHLIHESSPYLLQHAHNPVDWYPWGPEALAKAKKENKMIFLSIGYSSCHWCHVMERESFSNADVAKLMNDNFVCIKVDREERPEIDQIYMTALEVQNRSGGWPLSMFLLPDGRPTVGGTYWPPDDREIEGEKVRGFKSLLKIVSEGYRDNPKELEEHADKIAKATVQELAGGTRGSPLVQLDRDLIKEVLDELGQRFDKEHGGFGRPARSFKGTKFPSPPTLHLLQYEAQREKTKEINEILAVTLDHLARGGIYDQLGGGFHRYSTERTWTVPHFEKMLYDNAQLAEVYSRAFRATKKLEHRRIVQGILAFVDRELSSPEGGFYSALDADSEEEEGRFYVWTDDEIDAVLTDKADAKLFRDVYGAGTPNFEGKLHILVLPAALADQAKDKKMSEEELEGKLAPLRKKLFEARSKRTRPFLDTKILTSWNGQMIAGYAVAGQSLEQPKYVERAAKGADFILKTLRSDSGRLLHTYGAAPGEKPAAKLNAYLDDYASLIHGLLCLHDATNDKKWLDEAIKLADQMIKHHEDEKDGGFFYAAADQEKLFARAKDQYDGVQPCGNSMAALVLVQLWQKTGEERYQKLAEKTLQAFAAPVKNYGTNLTTMAEALSLYLDAKEKKK
jgi:uncharacterized protein YyaL (SSP411 family)